MTTSVTPHRSPPRLEVEVPDEVYEGYRAGDASAPDQLRIVVRAELRRRIAIDETDAYLTTLAWEVGVPLAAETRRAKALALRIQARQLNPIR
jgi:hypothetical protein